MPVAKTVLRGQGRLHSDPVCFCIVSLVAKRIVFTFFYALIDSFDLPKIHQFVQTLAHYQGDSINHCIIQLQLKGHMEPQTKAGSLTPAEDLVGFEPGAFQFYHVLTH